MRLKNALARVTSLEKKLSEALIVNAKLEEEYMAVKKENTRLAREKGISSTELARKKKE